MPPGEARCAAGRQVRKPFVARRKTFAFPAVDRMGQTAVSISKLTHGYGDHRLFDDASLQIGRGERVALIGAPLPTLRGLCDLPIESEL